MVVAGHCTRAPAGAKSSLYSGARHVYPPSLKVPLERAFVLPPALIFPSPSDIYALQRIGARSRARAHVERASSKTTNECLNDRIVNSGRACNAERGQKAGPGPGCVDNTEGLRGPNTAERAFWECTGGGGERGDSVRALESALM